MYSVEDVPERARKRDCEEILLFYQVQEFCSVEEEGCFGGADDQYGTCDLQTAGMGAACRARQGFDENAFWFFLESACKEVHLDGK